MDVVQVVSPEGTFTIYDEHGNCVGRVCTDTGRALIGDAFWKRVKTCRMETVKSGPLYDVWRCTACGAEFSESRTDGSAWAFEPAYCPRCGAQVVS